MEVRCGETSNVELRVLVEMPGAMYKEVYGVTGQTELTEEGPTHRPEQELVGNEEEAGGNHLVTLLCY